MIATLRRRHSARNTCARAWTRPRARSRPRPQSLTAWLVRSTPLCRLYVSYSVTYFDLRSCTRCLSGRQCFVRYTERLARPCGQQVVVPVERIVGTIPDHPDRLFGDERVTCDAHCRLFFQCWTGGQNGEVAGLVPAVLHHLRVVYLISRLIGFVSTASSALFAGTIL